MGVKLKDIIQPEQIDFKDLKGRAISIDAFNTLYQFLSTIRQRDGRPLSDSNGNITSHLSGILYRNSSMIEKDKEDRQEKNLKKNGKKHYLNRILRKPENMQ